MITNFENMLNDLSDIKPKTLTNTFAHIFRKENNENFISNWLAFLLDPFLVDSFEPLQCLLSLAGFDNLDISNYEKINIEREYTFENGRRIDFLIELDKSVIIAIENKIWSGLQDNQLEDYSKSLNEDKFKNYTKYCIFLFPNNNPNCNNISKSKLSSFKPVTYENLISELKNIKIDFTKNLRAAILMQDFITHMEEYIMNNNVDEKTYFEMLHFGNEYADTIKKLNEKISIAKIAFSNEIRKKLRERYPDAIWETNDKSSYYYQLYKSVWNIPHQVHFELIHENVLSPKKIKIVLHTHEYHKETNTDLFKLEKEFEAYLKKEYRKTEFEISYDTYENFNQSIDNILDILQSGVREFENKVDNAIKSM